MFCLDPLRLRNLLAGAMSGLLLVVVVVDAVSGLKDEDCRSRILFPGFPSSNKTVEARLGAGRKESTGTAPVADVDDVAVAAGADVAGVSEVGEDAMIFLFMSINELNCSCCLVGGRSFSGRRKMSIDPSITQKKSEES